MLVAAAVVSVATASCTRGGGEPVALRPAAPHHPTTTSTTATSATTTTTPVAPPPVTPISWSPCNGGLQCGTLVVPLDYANPKGPTIPVAVARHPAEDQAARIGSLVIDPGGPGVSGIDDMANELSALTPELLADFDIVMFDPRGVERSDPVTCGETPGAPPTTLSDPVPTTPEPGGGHHRGAQAVRRRVREGQRQRAAPRGIGGHRP